MPASKSSARPGLSLKGRALKYLAAREHSRLELARKLAAHAESAEQVESLLNDLERDGWLSAERFAASVAYRKSSRYGAARIKAELKQHRVPDDVTSSLIGELQSTELARAHALWQRRFGAVPADPQERARQSRFLLQRGFSGDVIQRILKGWSPEF